MKNFQWKILQWKKKKNYLKAKVRQINESNLEKINQKDNWIWIIETSGPKPNSTYGKNCMDYHKH